MGVICNGPRKAGTNALRAVVVALGFTERPGGLMRGRFYESRAERLAGRSRPGADIEDVLGPKETVGAHEPELVTRHVQIRILREPKAIMVSAYRAWWQEREPVVPPSPWPGKPRAFQAWLQSESGDAQLAATLPFFTAPFDGLTVRYEELFEAPTVDEIARACNVPVRDVAAAYGRSATWSGRPSCWQEWYSTEAASRFDERWSKTVEKHTQG